VYAVAVGIIVLLSISGSVSWLVYLAAAAWGCLVVAHAFTFVRNGDAHYGEQQIRVEWRAEQTKEHAVTRS
jgi:hypothetical protein